MAETAYEGDKFPVIEDPFSLPHIKERLRRSLIFRQVFLYPNLDSTNTVAMKLAEAGCPEGTLVIAEEQYQGRGRAGRAWVSPKGGLWLSIVFRPAFPAGKVFRLSMVASLAAARTISSLSGLKAEVKWPNDIMVNGRKVGGILLEFLADSDQVCFAVLGIGINVNFFPREFDSIGEIATSLWQEAGSPFPRIDILTSFLEDMEKGYKAIAEGQFPVVFDQWKGLLDDLGKWRKVDTPQGEMRGMVESVEEDGALLLHLPGGERLRVFMDLS